MPLLQLILLVAAFVCFTLAAVNVAHSRVNLTSLGLALASLAWLLSHARA